ncbi:hypothetical protein MBR_00255, partial [Metarhizium brunneum ARSEF 3297]
MQTSFCIPTLLNVGPRATEEVSTCLVWRGLEPSPDHDGAGELLRCGPTTVHGRAALATSIWGHGNVSR